MAEFLLGNTLVSDEKKAPCDTKFWVEGQGWTELEEVPPVLLAEAVKLLLKEKNAAYEAICKLQDKLSQILEIVDPE